MNHRLLYGWLSKDPVPGLKMLAGKHQNTINTVAEDYMVENEKKNAIHIERINVRN